jgi:hypothetical protein
VSQNSNEEMAQGAKTVKLEIIRETGNIHDKDASWLNRFVQDPESRVVPFLRVFTDSKGDTLLL